MSQKSSGDPAKALFYSLSCILRVANFDISRTSHQAVKTVLAAGLYNVVVAAITTFQQNSPDEMTPKLFVRLGCVLNKLGRYGEAVDAIRTAIKLDPTHPHPHRIFAEISLRRHPDDKDAALSHLKDAFDRAGKNTEEPFWFNLYENTIDASSSPAEAQETLRQWSQTPA